MKPTLIDIAVIGAGPVGLALALHASRVLPHARVTLFDSRDLAKDVAADPRTLALSLGSVQLLQRLGAWPTDVAPADPRGACLAGAADAALGRPLGAPRGAHPRRRRRRADARRGAELRRSWWRRCSRPGWTAARSEPQRLHSRFGTPVAALKTLTDGGGAGRRHRRALRPGGGGRRRRVRRAGAQGAGPRLRPDGLGRHRHAATAARRGWRSSASPAHGPLALLPLRDASAPAGQRRAALVWCVPSADDPVRELDDAQRLAVLNTLLPDVAGRITALSPLKHFALGLNAERTLVDGPQRAHRQCRADAAPGGRAGPEPGPARRLRAGAGAAPRAPMSTPRCAASSGRARADRWSMIAATDFLARSFTWQLPGLGAARGLGLAALQARRAAEVAAGAADDVRFALSARLGWPLRPHLDTGRVSGCLQRPDGRCPQHIARSASRRLGLHAMGRAASKRRRAYLPKTVFNKSVVRAAGFVRIFFSSSPTMWNRPSSDFLVT